MGLTGSKTCGMRRFALYDTIVVGARCAGAPTAMLLARAGYRVLLLDRCRFPSDSMRAHYIHPTGVAKLRDWGLLGHVLATGCPPIHTRTTDLGDFPLAEAPSPADGVDFELAPRRIVLDAILVEAAVAAGAELREGFAVTDLLTDGSRVIGIRGRINGREVAPERARLVIGADGLHSLVARAVVAPITDIRPALTCAYYSYWNSVPLTGAEVAFRPRRVVLAFPTNDRLSCVAVQSPVSEFAAFRADIEDSFHRALDDAAPGLAARVRVGQRVERWRGTADLPNVVRTPFGPGWALVGDAGYHKDPVTAQGISDAFRDSVLLTDAIDDGFSGREPMLRALAGYERRRNEAALPLFEQACARAAFTPFPPTVFAARAAQRTEDSSTSMQLVR